jgi:hypothetical protein
MNRDMGKFKVHQRTKDGMFNATSLLKQWNQESGMKKKIEHFFENQSTKEFIDTILESDDFHTPNSVYVKSRASRGNNAGTWMHPYLFIDFAMWINPKFKLEVIKFVYDQLIKQRHEAGDNYIILSSAGARLRGYNYSEVATALQWIVFNRTEKNLRQNASENQLKELANIQKQMAFAIDMGYIRTYDKLITELQKLWRKKYKTTTISA